MVIEKVKPTDENIVRITLKVSPDQIARAHAFRPESTQIVNKESGEFVFGLNVNSKAEIGKYGMNVPKGNTPTQPAVVLITLSGSASAEENMALLVRAQEYVPTIEDNIIAALTAYTEASKAIKEV